MIAGSKIKILDNRAVITKSTINKLWLINNVRNELLHTYNPIDLQKRSRFQSKFKDAIIGMSLDKTAADSPIDKQSINDIITSERPQSSSLSDCELVVTASQLLVHVMSKYFDIDDKDMMTLGE